MLVFGEVYDDVIGGEVLINIVFETLEGKRIISESVYLRRRLIDDLRSREAKMIELINNINNSRFVQENLIEKYESKFLQQEDDEQSNIVIKKTDVNVEVSNSFFQPPTLLLYLQNIDYNIEYELYYSSNDVEYFKYDGSKSTPLTEYKTDIFYVKVYLPQLNKVFGPFQFTGVFTTAFKKDIRKKLNYLVECSATGCQIDHRTLCNSTAQILRIYNPRNNSEITYRLPKDLCETAEEENGYRKICLASPNQIFPSKPGDKLNCNIIWLDGDTTKFDLVVSEQLVGGSHHELSRWKELIPSNNNIVSPYATAILNSGYNASIKPYSIFLGAGGCYSITQNIKSFLYDIDGSGFLEAEKSGTTQINMDIERPKNGIIELAYDLYSGERVGPFIYKFNEKEIIDIYSKEVIKHSNEAQPRLKFSYDRDGKFCAIPDGFNLLYWWDVKEVWIGDSQHNLKKVFDIDLNVENIIGYRSRKSKNYRMHRIPENWDNLFYKIIFNNQLDSGIIRQNLSN